MPELGSISRSTSLSAYQNLDGSNTTIGLYNVSRPVSNNTTVSAGIGGVTNMKDNSGVVLEGKVNHNFDNHFNVQGRYRKSITQNYNTDQYRVSFGYRTNVAPKTSVYVNPYVAEKVNHTTGKLSTDVGAFAGVTQKVGDNLSLSLEGQRYNIVGGKNTPDNWGINATACWTF